MQLNDKMAEYPQPDIRGPMPVNAHPDSTFSSFTHNDWTQVQLKSEEYPHQDPIRMMQGYEGERVRENSEEDEWVTDIL